MKGLDTNLLVRYLVRDEPKQAQKASAFIRHTVSAGDTCYIDTIVICELVWVLESAYGYAKEEIADVLDKVMMTKQFEIEQKEIVIHAIRDYREGKGDLSDYLIGRINHAAGCEITTTFDRALKGSASFEILD